MSPDIVNRKVIIHCALYMLFIFILSSIPEVSDKVMIEWEIQNLLHIPLYGVLGFLLMRAFFYNKFERKTALMLTLAIAIPYGFLDEFHQSFVPGRYASMADILFDTIGSLAGALIYRYKV